MKRTMRVVLDSGSHINVSAQPRPAPTAFRHHLEDLRPAVGLERLN